MSADKAPGEPSPARQTTAKPFMIALVVAVVLLSAVLTWSYLRPSGDRVNDSGQIAKTVGQYYGALNKGRYADLVANTCAKDREAADFPKEAGFGDARKAAVEREGEVTLDQKGIRDVRVNGDTATADLTLRYEKAGEREEKAKFVKEDDKWKKCS